MLPPSTFVLNCRPYYTAFEEHGAIKARKQTLLRHSSKAEPHFFCCSVSCFIRYTDGQSPWFTPRGGGVQSRSKFNFMGGFNNEINTPFLIYTASQVCMMTEIRRGEEHQVALWGWAEFTAPSPRRNYLTSLLIKSAYTAAHYNGRLSYSVQFSGVYVLTPMLGGVTAGLQTLQHAWQQ